jgi:hypothetical protein
MWQCLSVIAIQMRFCSSHVCNLYQSYRLGNLIMKTLENFQLLEPKSRVFKKGSNEIVPDIMQKSEALTKTMFIINKLIII